MIKSLKSSWLAAAAFAVPATAPSIALAQDEPIPPEHYTQDARGVDLVSGRYAVATTEVVIGDPGNGGLSYGRVALQAGTAGWRNLLRPTIDIVGTTNYYVSVGAEAEVFIKSGSVYTPQSNNGSTLVENTINFIYTTSSGVVTTFTKPGTKSGRALNVTHPSGLRYDYNYRSVNWCRQRDEFGRCRIQGNHVRLQSVTSNTGYQIRFEYETNDVEEESNNLQWIKLTGARGINMAVDACDPFADSCTYSRTWPSVTYSVSGSTEIVTDQSSRATSYTYGPYASALYAITGIDYPGTSATDVTIGYNSTGQATSVTDASGAWTYSYSTSGSTGTVVASGPLGQQVTAVSDLTIGRATSITQVTSVSPAASSTVSYQYDGQRRVSRVTQPEGDYAELTYDARGNATQTLYVAKSGSGLANISTSASFPSTCSNVVICNKPTTTTDARGAVTDFSWDATHGGLMSVTQPAPTSGADRPETRYGYGASYAWYKNPVGTLVQASTAVTLPTTISACATGTSCANAANEVRTTIAYGSSGVANNLQPTSISQGSGANPTMSVTTTTYTPNGDVASVDGPLAGTADTTVYRYDDARQQVGVIGPDPDAGGAAPNRAQRMTYNAAGQVTKSEVGTTAGQGDPQWAAFAPVIWTDSGYDSFGRSIYSETSNGGATPANRTVVSYDTAGRAACTAVRMNPTYASSTNACSPETPGANGPDRITTVAYDAAGRTTYVTTATGQAESITQVSTYTQNGKPASMTDGNGNVSVMVYDGHDRALRLRYPEPLSAGSTSTTDYTEVGYDAAGNVTSARNRAGQTSTVTFDALNRTTAIDAPSGTMDVVLTYDNLGRVLTSTGNSQTLTNVWDPLSRLTSQGGPLGAVGYQYDPAGAMTRITWPDAVYAAYDRDPYGAVTAIRENGATSGAGVLATYGYTSLGQMASITRGNGTGTSYSYDGYRRLSGITHDLSGTANDVTLGFEWNAAGQIITRTMTNAAYSLVPGAGSTSYANDGLNRVTSVAGTVVSYDANQNITAALGSSYAYDAAGRLTSATIGGSGYGFSYDPANRLYDSNGARMLYAGDQLIGEYNSSGVLAVRHVPGLGLDQPVATSFSGVGTVQQIADERGSVIATVDASGVANINRYDEYGVPNAANRFQYTGQAMLAPGLYNYRARAYAPELGRFLQTDPIGYGGGANLYGYVGADPVNFTDPSGMVQIASSCTGGYTTAGPSDDGLDIVRIYHPEVCSYSGGGPRSYVPPGFSGGGGGGGPEVPPAERDRFCSAYSALQFTATSFTVSHGVGKAGGELVSGKRINLGAINWSISALNYGGEALRVWGEVRGGRSLLAASAGAAGRLSLDQLAQVAGGAAGGLVGSETGPGAIVLAGVGAVTLPILLDAFGVREQFGDLVSGVAQGLTPEDCHG